MSISIPSANIVLSKVELANSTGFTQEVAKRGLPGLTGLTSARYSSGAQVGDKIYVVGRFCQRIIAGVRWSAIAALHIATSEWKWIFCEGTVSASCRMFLYNDSLYSYGLANWKGAASKDLSRFDLALEEWSDLNTYGQKPERRAYCSGHFLENRDEFLVFGGKAKGRKVNDIYLLRVLSRTWIRPKVKGNPPEPRWQHGSCVYKGVFYCCGGWGDRHRLNDGIFLLHFESGHQVIWSHVVLANAFVGVSSVALFPFANVLLLFGGRQRDFEFHSLSCYDPSAEKFTKLLNEQAFGVSTYGNETILIDNGRKVIILGGTNELDSYIRVSTLE